ncbi:ribose-5-phosphate isomerase RpiA [Chitinophaga lutea]
MYSIDKISHIEKQNAAVAAVDMLRPGMVVGLGTGSTAAFAISAIGERVRAGMSLTGVPTSRQTADLAIREGIPLKSLAEIDRIDVTIDGADEFTTSLMLIKGGGGALLREKLAALRSKEVIIIADSSKLVEKLGRFKVPLEVIPEAIPWVKVELGEVPVTLRMRDNAPFITESGNYILDADFALLEHPVALAHQLKAISGVVEHGLFIDLASRVLMGEGNTVREFLSLGP